MVETLLAGWAANVPTQPGCAEATNTNKDGDEAKGNRNWKGIWLKVWCKAHIHSCPFQGSVKVME